MKIKLLTLFILLSISLFGYNPNGILRDGFVVLSNNEKIDGKVMFVNKVESQEYVIFYANSNPNKKIEYKPTQLLGYLSGKEYYETIHVSSSKSIFALQKIVGKINLYVYYRFNPEIVVKEKDETRLATPEDDQYLELDYILKREDLSIKFISHFVNFHKSMSQIVSNDKNLSDKILKKLPGYKVENIVEIITEYNSVQDTAILKNKIQND